MWIEPFDVSGKYVRLIPLSIDHAEGLITAVRDGEVWKKWYASVPSPTTMHQEIERRLKLLEKHEMVPFTVLDTNGKMVGMTSYQSIDAANRRTLIGYTWYAQCAQRTGINTEAKLLLLGHAFEKCSAIAVGFTTNRLNFESRRAIERIGAKLDGTIRNHIILDNGLIRDTCCFSIIDAEWDSVKMHLKWLRENRADRAEGLNERVNPR